MAEWLKAPDCKSVDKFIFIGSNPIFFKFMELKKKTKYSKSISYSLVKKNSKIFGLNIKKYNVLLKTSHKNNIQKLENNNFFLLDKIKKYNSFNNNIKSYKSYRNLNGYPSRGQRTHTNGKTKKKHKF